MTINLSLPPMQRLVEYVLQNYATVEGICQGSGSKAEVARCVDCNSSSFYPSSQPKYDCGNFRRVYLVRFLATHVNSTGLVIAENLQAAIGAKDSLTVVSLGGGPGIEALALMDGLSKYDSKRTVWFENVDLETSWERVYLDIVQRFAKMVGESVHIDSCFSQYDVTTPLGGGYLPDGMGECDVVFVPWVLSHIDKRHWPAVLGNARDLSRPGGHVVVTDRVQQALVKEICTVVGTEGWHLRKHDTMLKKHCGVSVPDEIQKLFHVELSCSTAYWVLQKDSR